jgi:3',5'-cyclic-AMP phosphodiesterase
MRAASRWRNASKAPPTGERHRPVDARADPARPAPDDPVVLIAQLSDLHVRPPGVLYQGVADSNAQLGEAIDRLHALDRRPDLVLVTGDLVDHGHPDEYAHVRVLLDRLAMPYLVMPGNHDAPDALRAAFADHRYLPAAGPVHYCIDAHRLRIVALDTCVPGAHHGHVEDDGLRWLDATLRARPDAPTLLMLHHPPFVSGIDCIDRYRYRAPAALAGVLERAPQVRLVVCGHIHRFMMRRWAGTVVCSCPSTTTEIALQLAPAAPPRSFVGPRGYLLHLLGDDDGLVTHHVAIGDADGPHPFC